MNTLQFGVIIILIILCVESFKNHEANKIIIQNQEEIIEILKRKGD